MAVDPGRVFLGRIDDDVFRDEGRSAAMFDEGADGQTMPKADWSAALTAWDAVTSGALDRISNNAQVLEVLAGRRMDPLTGLNNIRRRLLAAARPEWTKMARVVGEAMAAGYDMRDDVGDAVLKFELEEMARLPTALVEITGEGAMRFCEVRVTSAGADLQMR